MACYRYQTRRETVADFVTEKLTHLLTELISFSVLSVCLRPLLPHVVVKKHASNSNQLLENRSDIMLFDLTINSLI